MSKFATIKKHFQDTPDFHFMDHRKIFFAIPLVLLAATLALTLLFGINLDIKFKGGTIVNVPYSGEVSLDDAQSAAKEALGVDCTVQSGQDGSSETLVITLAESTDLAPEKVSGLTDALSKKFPDNVKIEDQSEVEVTSVDPSVGADFFYKCLIAVGVAFLFIIIYIGIRFRRIGGISAALMGIIALLHDTAFVFAAMVVFRFPINDAFMAVVLTILGYSINNTIVIYDRIRENRLKLGLHKPIGEVVNLSINQTLTRSINTTITTVLALVVMLIVGLVCRIDSIVAFVLPMIVGMVAGTYSSIFISGPLWVLWKQKHPDKPKKAKKKKAKAGAKPVSAAAPAEEEIEVRTEFKINPQALEEQEGDADDSAKPKGE